MHFVLPVVSVSVYVSVSVGGATLYMAYGIYLYIGASSWASAPPIHTQLRAKNFN